MTLVPRSCFVWLMEVHGGKSGRLGGDGKNEDSGLPPG
jgi:hypothetical protein